MAGMKSSRVKARQGICRTEPKPKDRDDHQGQPTGKPGEREFLVMLHLLVRTKPEKVTEPAALDVLEANNAGEGDKIIASRTCLQAEARNGCQDSVPMHGSAILSAGGVSPV
jgi:hypothetical protein